LLAALVVAVFIDLTGWIAAFLDGGFYAALATLLQAVETVCIIGLAGLAVLGSVEAYRLQQARKKVTEEFESGYS
jgi:predicted benzoate:H+ symporter BenE